MGTLVLQALTITASVCIVLGTVALIVGQASKQRRRQRRLHDARMRALLLCEDFEDE